jgi:hypothetical protein
VQRRDITQKENVMLQNGKYKTRMGESRDWIPKYIFLAHFGFMIALDVLKQLLN